MVAKAEPDRTKEPADAQPKKGGGEWVNPRSMLTPGGAGAMVLMIAGALTTVFPGYNVNRIALILSFVLGFLVFQGPHFKRWKSGLVEKGLLYVFNSLLIFAAAVGGFEVADRAAQSSAGAFRIGPAPLFARAPIRQDTIVIVTQRSSLRELGGSRRLEMPPFPTNTYGYRIESTVVKKETGIWGGVLGIVGLKRSQYEARIRVVGPDGLPVGADSVIYQLGGRRFDHSVVTVPGAQAGGFSVEFWANFYVNASVILSDGTKIPVGTIVRPRLPT